MGPERIDSGVPHDAAGSGNPLATLANTVQLGRQFGFIGRRRRRGRFVQHPDGRRGRAPPVRWSQPNRIGGRRLGAQFVPGESDEGSAASSAQPESPLPTGVSRPTTCSKYESTLSSSSSSQYRKQKVNQRTRFFLFRYMIRSTKRI